MTGPGARGGAAADGWRGCVPELTLAAVLVAATAAAAYGYAGAGAAVLALVIWAVVLLAGLRALVPAGTLAARRPEPAGRAGQVSFTGLWRTTRMLSGAADSMVSYDAELRPTLQHLLAARLAERHGVSLYADPAAARRLLLPAGARGDQLWYWLDPTRPADTRQHQRGIPPRTLAAILDRLERL